MKSKATILVLIFGLALNFKSHADTFSYPGGVAQFTILKQTDTLPDVKFGLNEPVVMEYPNYWRILVGLGLETLPGDYVAYVKPAIEGAPGQYKKIIVKQQVYPFSEHAEFDSTVSYQAISRTHDSFSDIDFSNTQQPTLPLRLPLEGNWSSNFGHKLYDVKKKVLHIPNAIVLSTTQLSTVVAPQTAIVSKIETSSSGLSTIFLDHGRGLYSILSGLDDITVEVGNGIVAGAVIGKLPAVKKSVAKQSPLTSSILVWQTVINNSYVDPQVLTKLEP